MVRFHVSTLYNALTDDIDSDIFIYCGDGEWEHHATMDFPKNTAFICVSAFASMDEVTQRITSNAQGNPTGASDELKPKAQKPDSAWSP